MNFFFSLENDSRMSTQVSDVRRLAQMVVAVAIADD